jgi:hypothetical protein
LNFELDLIFEEPRVVHHVVVEDVVVGESSEDDVEGKDAYQGYDGKGEELAGNVVARPCRDGGEIIGR